MTGAPANQKEVDLDEVRKLLDTLERDLEHVNDDSSAVQRLKDEVQTLRNVLESPVRRHHWVRDSLHGIREAFDSAGAAKASRYVAEIGRILGL
jgi:cell division septum initiation protein DivIVA